MKQMYTDWHKSRLFGDLKEHGFDIETAHLNNILKLARLTLAVVITFV